MPMRRWEQIKRFIHASPIVEEVPQERWFEKMQPLADQVQANFQRWVILATDVAIDEMMVKFKGRSKDTIRMREKPIKEGYKVFVLSEHGYTWAFLFSSRIMGPVDLRPWANVWGLGFSKTDQTVVQLAGSLPSREFSFNIFFDNLFSNIPLFHALRSLDIGATGTVRPNSREYPTEFKFRGRGPIFPHNTVSGLVRRDVLAVLWQDKKLRVVRFLTTIHTLTSPSDYILVDRNRPRVNTELVRQGSRGESTEPLLKQLTPPGALSSRPLRALSSRHLPWPPARPALSPCGLHHSPDPAHPNRFKPGHQGHQATVPRGPYVSKRFGLPLARFMTDHTHRACDITFGRDVLSDKRV
jgi:hypothetical protein